MLTCSIVLFAVRGNRYSTLLEMHAAPNGSFRREMKPFHWPTLWGWAGLMGGAYELSQFEFHLCAESLNEKDVF